MGDINFLGMSLDIKRNISFHNCVKKSLTVLCQTKLHFLKQWARLFTNLEVIMSFTSFSVDGEVQMFS